ncbi:MAG: phytanoyl-CoA dioxygenase family protein [Saprospiraceae bacterium]|nr:phytanoyl-CoA dioxygenase family protein [Pyrinomonadaceae bacterium]
MKLDKVRLVKDPGFWIEENVFSELECSRILETLSHIKIKRSRAGARNLMAIPEIWNLSHDARLLSICEKIIGRTMIAYKATLFEKTGKANWLVAFHQDTAVPLEENVRRDGWGPSSTKQGVNFVHAPTWALSQILALRIQLDDSTSGNGPLRVIPGSHHRRLKADDEFEVAAMSEKIVECTAGKGSVIAMSPLLLHASSKALNDNPRRVLHFEYAPDLQLGVGIRLAIS